MKESEIITSLYFFDDTQIRIVYDFPVYKILYISEGNMCVSLNGYSYKITANSLVCFNNFENLEIQVLSRPCRRYLLCLNPLEFERNINEPIFDILFKTRFSENNIFAIDNPSMVISFFALLENEKKTADLFSTRFCSSQIFCFLADLFRSNREHFLMNEHRRIPVIAQVQQHIDSNYSENITISDLCDKFFVSQSYLNHKFKEIVGYSPIQYLKLLRLSHSRRLLITTSFTVNQISECCGFEDQNNFTKAFKKQYSMTPSEFRKTYSISAR